MDNGWFQSTEPVEVKLEGCRCPGTPHSHDSVWLRSELPPEAGIAAVALSTDFTRNREERIEALGRIYLRHGIVRWTFLDAEGKVIPVTSDVIDRLKWAAAEPIADQASEIYSEQLFRPLVVTASESLPNGQSAPSTSARKRSTSTPPKP